MGFARSTPAGGLERELGGERRSNQGLRRSSIPGEPFDSGWWGQSRAPSTPPWRSGVQCGRPVRDPARPEALGAVKRVAWPRRAWMEAGAPAGPTGNLSRQPVARRRKTEGAIPWLRVTVPATARLGNQAGRRVSGRSGGQKVRRPVASGQRRAGTQSPPAFHWPSARLSARPSFSLPDSSPARGTPTRACVHRRRSPAAG